VKPDDGRDAMDAERVLKAERVSQVVDGDCHGSVGRVWQAEYMISGVRDHVLALACLRHGGPAAQGRGMDCLPPAATPAVAGALVRSLDISELARAFRVATEALLAEAGQVDAGLADRLAATLRELAR
jgi:hypothetical protein